MALTKITPQMFDTSATAHDLNVDNGTFVVDGSASRVGIGTATPSTLLDVNGALTAGSVAVDNITIDGTEIDLSSGDLLLDVAGNIKLDADDAGEVRLLDGGTQYLYLKKDNNTAVIENVISNGAIQFRGLDGSTPITALTLQISDAGAAIFNNTITSKTINITGDNDDLIISSADYENVYLGNRGSSGANLDKGYFRMKSEGTNTVVIDTAADSYFTGGNVGIGTTSPYKKLTLSAAFGTQKADLLDLQSTVAGGGTQPMIRFGTMASNSNTLARIGVVDIPNYGGGFVVETNSSGGATDTTTEKFRIDKDGNVGINDTGPDWPLDIKGVNSGVQLQIGRSVGGSTGTGWFGADGTGIHIGPGTYSSGGFDVSSPALKILTTSGNVGIGVPTPDQKLMVKGTIETVATNSANGWQLYTYTDNTFRVNYNGAGADEVIINSDGDVGIGASPAAGVRFQTVHNVADEWVGDFKHTHANAYGLRVDLSGSTSSTRLAFGTYTGGGTGFFVRNDGNVGTGIASPTSRLHIKDANTDTRGEIKFETGTGGNTGKIVLMSTNNTDESAFIRKRSYYLELNAHDNEGLILGTNSTELLRLCGPNNSTTTYRNAAVIYGSGGCVPSNDNGKDLGSTSLRWRNIYTADLHLSNEGSKNDVDGTSGNWTIQEGETDLYIINNKSGKKYKFALEEIE